MVLIRGQLQSVASKQAQANQHLPDSDLHSWKKKKTRGSGDTGWAPESSKCLSSDKTQKVVTEKLHNKAGSCYDLAQAGYRIQYTILFEHCFFLSHTQNTTEHFCNFPLWAIIQQRRVHMNHFQNIARQPKITDCIGPSDERPGFKRSVPWKETCLDLSECFESKKHLHWMSTKQEKPQFVLTLTVLVSSRY